MTLGEGGAVGQRGAGADGVGGVHGDVGEQQRALAASRVGDLVGRPPLIVERCLRRAFIAAMGRPEPTSVRWKEASSASEIRESQGPLHHGGGSAADEEEDGGPRGNATQQIEGSVGGAERVFVGRGVRAAQEHGVGERFGRRRWSDDDGVAVKLREAVECLVGGPVHRDGRLAHGEDQDLIELGERDALAAEGERFAVAAQLAVDGAAHVDVAHGLGEDGSRVLGEREDIGLGGSLHAKLDGRVCAFQQAPRGQGRSRILRHGIAILPQQRHFAADKTRYFLLQEWETWSWALGVLGGGIGER